MQFIKKRINAIQQFIVKKTNLFKNNSLAAILFAAKTEIDAMLLRLSNLSCVYLFVSGYITTDRAKQKVHIFADTKN